MQQARSFSERFMGFLLQVSEANKGMFERERLAGGWAISAFVAGRLHRYGSLPEGERRRRLMRLK